MGWLIYIMPVSIHCACAWSSVILFCSSMCSSITSRKGIRSKSIRFTKEVDVWLPFWAGGVTVFVYGVLSRRSGLPRGWLIDLRDLSHPQMKWIIGESSCFLAHSLFPVGGEEVDVVWGTRYDNRRVKISSWMVREQIWKFSIAVNIVNISYESEEFIRSSKWF